MRIFKTKEDMINQASHEMIVYLTAILSKTSFIKRRCIKNRFKKIIISLEDNVNSLATLISNIRYVPHNQTRPFLIEPIRNYFYNAINVYKSQAEFRNINFSTSFIGDDSALVSDFHFNIAVINLISNSIQYSFNGCKKFKNEIKVYGEPHGTDYYCISISNIGYGILPTEIKNNLIFEDGYRGVLIRGNINKGLGRGLYIVKNVVEDYNGWIEVSSNPVNCELYSNTSYLTIFKIFLNRHFINYGEKRLL